MVAAGAAVAAALLLLGSNTSTDEQQTTQTTWTSATTIQHRGGDVFRVRIFGHADSPDKDEWWLAFNVTMAPSEEWGGVAVAPEVFFVQLSDKRYVAGQGVRTSMILQTGGGAMAASKKDEFPTTTVKPGETVSGLVLFLLPKDSSIAEMFFNNGQVSADLPRPPT